MKRPRKFYELDEQDKTEAERELDIINQDIKEIKEEAKEKDQECYL